MQNRPIIGLLMDYQESGDFSSRPHYALRCSYFDAIWQAGGLPVAVPYIDDAIDSYLQRCNGLILPGGSYPFPTGLYGEDAPAIETHHPRYAFESNLAKRSLDADTPLLGICAGMQVMAAAVGATMYRDVREDLPTTIDHLNERPAEEPAHGVEITAGSRLHSILGVEALQVNTAHKEAIKTLPDSLRVNAVASDGVIEGIELPGHRFCLGIQWHPEFFAEDDDPNMNLFTALVEAASS